MNQDGFWHVVWSEYKKSKIGMAALYVLSLFIFIGLYAPLFASSKPLLALWEGSFYSPLFRYLYYAGFYTKPIDLFFNLLMFTLPLALLGFWLLKKRIRMVYLGIILCLQIGAFVWILTQGVKSPEHAPSLQVVASSQEYHEDPLLAPLPTLKGWAHELATLAPYKILNQLLEYKNHQAQHERLKEVRALYTEKTGHNMPTPWYVEQQNILLREKELVEQIQASEMQYLKARDQLPILQEAYRPFAHSFIMAKYALQKATAAEDKEAAKTHLTAILEEALSHRAALAAVRNTLLTHQKTQNDLRYLIEKREWLEKESLNLKILIAPFMRSFHWEEDAGGAQEANQYLPWWELTRINRKDLVASLLFGIRVSLVVGGLAIALSLLIGIPLGTIAGYFAGKWDLLICRLLEMWEASPTFFVLLLVIAITQSKSIFLVIGVLGLFGWTGFARYIRSEVLKQRKLPYVEACRSLGYPHTRIMFSHILPNAIPPILTLLPFSLMAAITSESALSFLGLGEEGSTSWGVLMDEGRSVFPAESYLLWPPAVLLTILLITIALVGDTLRDALDPKMRH